MNASGDLLPFGPLRPEGSPHDEVRRAAVETAAGTPAGPPRDFDFSPQEVDDSWPVEIDDEAFDALLPEDEYEPLPEYGDFWPDPDAA